MDVRGVNANGQLRPDLPNLPLLVCGKKPRLYARAFGQTKFIQYGLTPQKQTIRNADGRGKCQTSLSPSIFTEPKGMEASPSNLSPNTLPVTCELIFPMGVCIVDEKEKLFPSIFPLSKAVSRSPETIFPLRLVPFSESSKSAFNTPNGVFNEILYFPPTDIPQYSPILLWQTGILRIAANRSIYFGLQAGDFEFFNKSRLSLMTNKF